MTARYLERSKEGEHQNVYALREDMQLVVNPGTEWEEVVGAVAHRENFHLACDAADEEIRCLLAEFEAFG